MIASPFRFELHHVDIGSRARRATWLTPHGSVELPAFMPVGTQGSVKGLAVDRLQSTGAQMVLANAYHLALRPGEAVVEQLGGLHRFMQWEGPLLTDSGGFQLFSLAQLTRVSDAGACFRAHTDGRLIEFSPERVVEIQQRLGSDVAMVLDHVVPLPSERRVVQEACRRTVLWACRSRDAHCRTDQALWSIVQGGLDTQMRGECAEQLVALDFAGYAIGGLSVGETPRQMYEILSVVCPLLPEDRPRYLMGVGRPQDLLEGIRRGVDLFDCVIPTRNGRNAVAFTDGGTLHMRNLAHKTDSRPIDPSCGCAACGYSRGYLRHLFMAREMLGPILLSVHNLTYYQRLLAEVRAAIVADRFEAFFQQKMRSWQQPGG